MSYIKKRAKQYYTIVSKRVRLKKKFEFRLSKSFTPKNKCALLCEITFNFIQLKSKRTINMKSN